MVCKFTGHPVLQQFPIGVIRESWVKISWDSQRHAAFAALRRIRFFAPLQSLKRALPVLVARSASRSAWACHAGDSKRSSSLERSAHSASMAGNFSSRDIFFSGRATGMKTTIWLRAFDEKLPVPQCGLTAKRMLNVLRDPGSRSIEITASANNYGRRLAMESFGAASSRDAAFNRIVSCPLIGVRAKSKDGFSDFPQVLWWQFRLHKCSPDVL